MMKSILIACSFVLCAAVCAQTVQAYDCYNCTNPYAYSNSWCGRTVLNDKLVPSHDATMCPGGGFGIPLFQGFFLPRGGYVGGHGGNRYGGAGYGGGYPYYIYRGPRDFLNPNPPSIGY